MLAFPLRKAAHRAPERGQKVRAEDASGDRRRKKTGPHAAAAPLPGSKYRESRQRIKDHVPQCCEPVKNLPEDVYRKPHSAERRTGHKGECQLKKLPGRRFAHLSEEPRPEAAPHRDVGIREIRNISHNEKIAGVHRERLHPKVAPMHRESAKLRLHLHDALVKAADLFHAGNAQASPVFQYDVLCFSPLGLSRHTITPAQAYAAAGSSMLCLDSTGAEWYFMRVSHHAGVAELADARDLKSRDESRTGSIPVTGTTSEGANTVPFPPCGENCTMLAPSSFPNRIRSAGLRFGFP